MLVFFMMLVFPVFLVMLVFLVLLVMLFFIDDVSLKVGSVLKVMKVM